MATIKDHILVQVNLATAVATAAGFVQALLIDDAQVPYDQRYLLVTQSAVSDTFTSGTAPRRYADTFFSQAVIPSQLMVARWRSTAIAAQFIWGASYETDYLVWKAISDGSINFVDSTVPAANEVALSGLDFSAITELSQVATVINVALAALVAPAITGLDSATIEVDSLDRFYLQMPSAQAGAGNPSVIMEATDPVVGTDLSTLMDTDNSIIVAPADAETLTEAMEAVQDKYPAWYIVRPYAAIGTYQTQMEALAAYCQANTKVAHFVSNDPNAKSSAVSTDLGPVLKALSYNRSMVIYTERDEFPQAAMAGRALPELEGSNNWAWNALIGVTQSGATDPLTVTERATLKSKGYNYVESLNVGTIIYPGLMVEGEEMRIIIGRDWFQSVIEADLATAQINNDLMAFDNATIAIVREILNTRGAQAIERRIIVDTPDRPWTITLPDEDDFTALDRASHQMVITNAFNGYVNSAVNDWQLSGDWTI